MLCQGRNDLDTPSGVAGANLLRPAVATLRCFLPGQGVLQQKPRVTEHKPENVSDRGTLSMPQLIAAPTIVQAAGQPPKRIEEYVGRVNTGHAQLSVARMVSPVGWQEPGQRPEFLEVTVVLKGRLQVEHEGGVLQVAAGQAVVAQPGEWVRYSTPEEGAEYVAVCLPAFSPDTVHRDA
jgi:quercetin dioxygenase-like cupin family protein